MHEQALAGWDWNAFSAALGLYWDLQDPQDGELGEAIEPGEREMSGDALAEAVAAIAAYVYPGDPTTFDEAVLADKVETSEILHEVAEALTDPNLHALADSIASPTIHALNEFAVAYLAYNPFRSVVAGLPSEAAAAALRGATRGAMESKPRDDFELCWKIRTAALVGIHARLKREFVLPARDAATPYEHFRRHLDRLPNWILGGVFDRRLRPAWINALGVTRANGDAQLILDAIRDAGPAWLRSIAADVERLKGLRGDRAA